MKIVSTKDYTQMSRMAANLISAQLLLKPHSVLGLATGSSPIGAYTQLIEWYRKGDLDFSACHSVNLDEYVGLGADNEQSYAFFMRHNLFDHVNIRPENTHIPCGVNLDAADECARYDRLIAQLGGIDLQLLGLGHNGHIGFNEPSEGFPVGTHCVQLTETTIQANRRFFQREEDIPRMAYTMGVRDIIHARRVVMVVSGQDKADIVRRAFFGPITPTVPASILQLHQDFTLVADEAALSQL